MCCQGQVEQDSNEPRRESHICVFCFGDISMSQRKENELPQQVEEMVNRF